MSILEIGLVCQWTNNEFNRISQLKIYTAANISCYWFKTETRKIALATFQNKSPKSSKDVALPSGCGK